MKEDYKLDILLEQFLFSYPNAKGVTLHSLEHPIDKSNGSGIELLQKYKDIPMMSVDETFNTSFTFIITDEGSIVIFFINNLHFLSVYTESTEPNKELASRMHESFSGKFETLIKEIYESEQIY